jgi:glycosyltransferase involved in cell wall biosynthesis
MASVSVIIPAFNEENTLGGIVREILGLHSHFEVLVINDGSTDKTAEVAAVAGAKVYSHPYYIGNGASIKAGIRVRWNAWIHTHLRPPECNG